MQRGNRDIAPLDGVDVCSFLSVFIYLLPHQPVVGLSAVVSLLDGIDMAPAGQSGYLYPLGLFQGQAGQVYVEEGVTGYGVTGELLRQQRCQSCGVVQVEIVQGVYRDSQRR